MAAVLLSQEALKAVIMTTSQNPTDAILQCPTDLVTFNKSLPGVAYMGHWKQLPFSQWGIGVTIPPISPIAPAEVPEKQSQATMS